VLSDHEHDIRLRNHPNVVQPQEMLGGVDSVVLNDPASDEPTFGNRFRTLTAYYENRGYTFSAPRRPRNAPLGDSRGRAHRACRGGDRWLVALVKHCDRGRGDEPHSERDVDDAGSPWIAKHRRD
jgi:hypothetical protein